ncbi:MAG TPA: hypothetical protein VGB53_00385 [Rubricoccaceae bacterium]|jgi:hypothetical protein
MPSSSRLEVTFTTNPAPPEPHVSVAVDMDLGANVLLRVHQRVPGREPKSLDLMVSAERAGAVAHVLTASPAVLARYSEWLVYAVATLNGLTDPGVRGRLDPPSPDTQPPS